ncbi:sarcosine oxidase subunit gamma family protein [Amycolatopsis rhabdoformis]|uniref:Sarcosine oxidase subunit gamma family protein n=1 Tax=Amycolatopsis rhabdoformis TaxID=1448059 RepID=A0ABZ1IEE9_9PSEU|nr:sarcosine oxidase subunit gamma family protein [Amycolatopsis rhabdoformis]WSE32802.1 sarcosine oxidase subunit gamma family protein [Amycolatopsis rhabdoformis]
MTADLKRRAPLEDHAGALAALAPAVLAQERPFLTQLTVRVRVGHAATGGVLGVPLPDEPCTFTSGTGRFGTVDVLWLGPDEYLVLAAPGLAAEIEAALREAIVVGAVTDTSAQRTTVRLAGPAVRDVLAHGCAIDLDPAASPPGTCVQTLLARTGIVLLVRAGDEFTVLVRQSFAPYFAAWLADAATEYTTDSIDDTDRSYGTEEASWPSR